jgi:hypothetical protein
MNQISIRSKNPIFLRLVIWLTCEKVHILEQLEFCWIFDFGRLERMEGGNRSSATNSNNSSYEVDRERVLSFMRDVEGGVGIIPGASIESSTEATTTQTEAARLRRYYSQSIFRWGELDGVRIFYIEDDEGEDYLRRFTLADNDILIRYIRYFRPRLNYSTAIFSEHYSFAE